MLQLIAKKKSIQDALWMVFGFSGRIGLQGVYFILLARYLGSTDFGFFSGAFALINIIAPFSSWGSGNLLVMDVSRDTTCYSKHFGNSLLFLLCGGCIFTFLLVIFGNYLLNHINWIVILNMSIADLFFSRLFDVCCQVFQAFEKLKTTARLYILNSGSRLLFVFCFIIFPSVHNLIAWSYFYLCASMFSAVITLFLVIKNYGHPTFTREYVIYTLRKGVFFSLGVTSTSVYTDGDKVILTRLEPGYINGAYSAAYRLISMAFAPVQAIVFSSNTSLFRDGAKGVEGVIHLIKRIMPIIVGYSLIMCAALYVLSPVITILLGKSYRMSSEIIVWLLPLLVLQSVNYLLGDALMGAGLQNKRSHIQIIVAILVVILDFLFIPHLSWRGAALVAIFGQLSLAIILSLMIFRPLVMKNKKWI